MPAPRQLDLLPPLRQSAEERREWIRRRLEGFEYRQAAREAKREAERDRRKDGGRRGSDDRQVTLAEILARSEPGSADLD